MTEGLSDWTTRLDDLPDEWRSADVTMELLSACLDPSVDPVGPPPDGTRWQLVKLPCRPATAKSTAGGRAFVASCAPEFFVRIGWTPVPELRTVYYMVPPERGDQPPSAEILVPVPRADAVTALAAELHAAGVPWQGRAWHWPATFTPAVVSREWREKSYRIWDGPTGGGTEEIPAGWEEKSTPAACEIGLFGVWQVGISWKPEPSLRELIGLPWM